MEMLTAKVFADITGCNLRTVQRWAESGKVKSAPTLNGRNQKEYLIPVTELDPLLQKKYYSQQLKQPPNIAAVPENAEATPLDSFSEKEREEIAFWIDIVNRWQDYRNAPKVKKKTDVDDLFVAAVKLENPELCISVDTLYRRWAAYKENRLQDLIDNRGKYRKGKSTVQPPMWDAFLYYYLDEAQHPITKCYQYMVEAVKEEHPELFDIIPSDASFRRRIISDLPIQLQILGRKGEKAYRDACGFYIRREYEDMQANEYWIGDTHTLDIQSSDNDGSIHRLYLSAFMDARSGVMVGWHISTSPSSQTTLLALRDGLTRRRAIPENIYVDNGREFLTHDIGGLGHRAKKPKNDKDRFDPPPVFKRLGIKMTNAIVRNARAKTIERRFCDFKNQVSRLFETFTGGNIMERPECLKARIKNGNVIIDEQLIEEVNLIIEYYFNYEQYGGSVKADQGKLKMEVYNEHSHTVRVACEEDLNLMLLRSSRVQTFSRRGVTLSINEGKLDYWSEEARQVLFGKKVYYRYDPYNLSSIRVYDLEDRFVMTVPCTDNTVLKYGAGQEEIKAAQKIIRTAERNDKEKLKVIKTLGYKTAREIVLGRAMENARNPVAAANPRILDLVRAAEEPLYQEAVGFASLDVINRNAMKKQGGKNDE